MTRAASPARRTVAVIYAGGSGSQREPAQPDPTQPAPPEPNPLQPTPPQPNQLQPNPAEAEPNPAQPGLLAPLAGRPIVEHSLAAFTAAPGVDEVLMIAGPALADRTYNQAPRIIEPAATRAQSIALALRTLAAEHDAKHGADCDVLIHDADRPLVAPHVIADCLDALAGSEAVCAAVPASDTMVAVEHGLITGRPPRDRLRRRQYPQGFRLPVISRGYQLALADPDFRQADDCAVLLRYLPGVPVRLVHGSEHGFRITSQADLAIAETLLQAGRP